MLEKSKVIHKYNRDILNYCEHIDDDNYIYYYDSLDIFIQHFNHNKSMIICYINISKDGNNLVHEKLLHCFMKYFRMFWLYPTYVSEFEVDIYKDLYFKVTYELKLSESKCPFNGEYSNYKKEIDIYLDMIYNERYESHKNTFTGYDLNIEKEG